MFSALKGLKTPQPFCTICFRYMTPKQAGQHKRHAKAIRWPKKK